LLEQRQGKRRIGLEQHAGVILLRLRKPGLGADALVHDDGVFEMPCGPLSA